MDGRLISSKTSCRALQHVSSSSTRLFKPSVRPPRTLVYAGNEGRSGADSSDGKPAVQLNDAMLAELRAAQEEAARLRKELESVRSTSVSTLQRTFRKLDAVKIHI
jgi:hypothetical protein